MFAVGHLALGYICGFATSKVFKTNLNIPLILVLSVVPDMDILIPQLQHRGPTHSIIVATILFIPFFIIYKRKALPYFAALIQHFLIGDFIAGGNIQLFWPLTAQYYGIEIGITNPINMTAEWILFIVSVSIMLKTNEIATLFKPYYSNLLLVMPVSTVLLPTFLSFPLKVPIWLIPPHIVYISIFAASIIVALLKFLKTKKR